MFKCRVTPLLLLLFVLAQTARSQNFVGPPYLTPAAPTPLSTIAVNIEGDGCEVLDDGVAPYPISQSGNAITVVFTGAYNTDQIFCIYTPGVQTYSIGQYPAGDYTLGIIWRYPGIGGDYEQQVLGNLPFTVSDTGSSLVALPATGAYGLAVLVTLMLLSAAFALRKSHLVIFTFILLPILARAGDLSPDQTIAILVTTAPGAPTPDDLVNTTLFRPHNVSSRHSAASRWAILRW